MTARHPLLAGPVVRAIEQAAAAHLGEPWTSEGFTDLGERAAHPAGIHRGRPFSVFAKLACGAGGGAQFAAEARGLAELSRRARVMTPVPVGPGVVQAGPGFLMLSEALPERPPSNRTRADWGAIGGALGSLHQVRADQFGFAGFDAFFGPLRLDNRPVPTGRWADFYAERRLAPLLRLAADSGHLPTDLVTGVERILARMPRLAGPEPAPALLHGDAQHHNFISTDRGAVVIDPCPSFGHPEIDLALLGYLHPVPGVVLDAYREHQPVDPGFEGRRELWRLFAYLVIVAVAGAGPMGREFLGRIASAIRQYS